MQSDNDRDVANNAIRELQQRPENAERAIEFEEEASPRSQDSIEKKRDEMQSLLFDNEVLERRVAELEASQAPGAATIRDVGTDALPIVILGQLCAAQELHESECPPTTGGRPTTTMTTTATTTAPATPVDNYEVVCTLHIVSSAIAERLLFGAQIARFGKPPGADHVTLNFNVDALVPISVQCNFNPATVQHNADTPGSRIFIAAGRIRTEICCELAITTIDPAHVREFDTFVKHHAIPACSSPPEPGLPWPLPTPLTEVKSQPSPTETTFSVDDGVGEVELERHQLYGNTLECPRSEAPSWIDEQVLVQELMVQKRNDDATIQSVQRQATDAQTTNTQQTQELNTFEKQHAQLQLNYYKAVAELAQANSGVPGASTAEVIEFRVVKRLLERQLAAASNDIGERKVTAAKAEQTILEKDKQFSKQGAKLLEMSKLVGELQDELTEKFIEEEWRRYGQEGYQEKEAAGQASSGLVDSKVP